MLRPVLAGVLVGLFPIAALLAATRDVLPPAGDDLGPTAGGETLLVASARAPQPPRGATGFWVHGLPLLPRLPEAAPAGDQAEDQPVAEAGDPAEVELTAEQLVEVEEAARTEVAREAEQGASASAGGALGAAVPPAVRQWEDLIVRSAEQHGLDPNLIAALMMTESGGDPAAISPKGAVGLMQVMGGSLDPEANVQQGAAILARNLARYGRLDLALAAYNAGPGSVDRYGGVPPFRETRDHVFRVLLRLDLYGSR